MTSARLVWLVLCLGWVAAEIRLARQTRRNGQNIVTGERRTQNWLWLSILTGLGLALLFKQLAWFPLPPSYLPRQLLALAAFGGGLSLRFWAVQHLGRFFTTHVTIQQRHRLITSGPYRAIRHPAYTGLLLALTAAGWAMGDFLALLCLTLPVFWGFRLRIDIEEGMLRERFGDSYREYCRNSWRLLPWLY
ncbi:isoprenylcysteine carboxylmethyltransferase family protein [Methylomonas sp. SURF-2]|uniref:Isoprenylcysteine carboxylmethyltransferase family protein n=1 Tax=Methylomonas subterranea TaxID=2952225 RepID=A0ABT1TH36_9GAMM|nr:isoprenylcysteine carboxylmethyltransferase family protein [Methylomonas sp. SURF-2]MCQ8104780.1 isoprenylcysteine carboxylmethyltransferase family protein [Methylomonas sp. SURF-2]